MAMDQNAYEYLKIGRRFVLEIVGQPATFCGIGACDPYLKDHISALSPFRFSTGAFSWAMVTPPNPQAIDANPPPNLVTGGVNLDGGDLVLLAGATINLFQDGIDDPGTAEGVWWILTTSDTDLTEGGDPISRNFLFFVTGMVFEALQPFQRGGAGTGNTTDPKLFSAWLNLGKYQAMLQAATIAYTAIEMQFGISGQRYRLGVGDFWPQWGGAAGEGITRNGLTSAPGLYLPTVVGICIAAREELKKLQLTLSNGVTTEVQNQGGADTVAGSVPWAPLVPGSKGTINQANIGTVYQPVRIMLIGYIVCVPEAQLCGLPVLSPNDVDMLTRLARQMAPGQYGPPQQGMQQVPPMPAPPAPAAGFYR